MTTEKINALIAQHVFGYEMLPPSCYQFESGEEPVFYGYRDPKTGDIDDLPDYAGSYAGMGMLIEKLGEDENFSLTVHRFNEWLVVVSVSNGHSSVIDAEELPLAVALATLEAYGVSIAESGGNRQA
jgi:hypothetical protein